MATVSLYLIDSAVGGWQRLSETPAGSAATIVGGWVVSTGTTNHSEFEQGVERAAATFTGTTVPDGSLDVTLFDAFRSENAYTGDFASGNWVAHFVVRAVTNGGAQDGRVRFRLIKADADGANATEITAAQQQGALLSNVSTSADFDSTLTFNPGAFSIANQYLFLQVAWERTGAGGMTSADIDFRTGSSTTVGTRFTTADFTVSFTGFGAVTTAGLATSGSGAQVFSGSGAATTAGVETDGTGAQVFSGSGAATTAGVETDGTGEVAGDISGSGSVGVAGLASAGTGSEVFSGSGTIETNGLETSGSGSQVFTGSGSVAAPGLTTSGTGSEVFSGTGAVSTAGLASAGTGGFPQDIAGAGAGATDGLTSSGTGSLVFAGNGSGEVGGLESDGSGSLVFAGAAAGTSAGLQVTGEGTYTPQVISGTGTCTVAGLETVGEGDLLGLIDFGVPLPWWIQERIQRVPDRHPTRRKLR